ncbi:protease inhibitor I42 family protein [Aquipseudomonas campi]|uniref:Protease inhibitor I42 family protein n=1 Tax=Aquipseudomonas campi TaxID=2731681 RepID=A0A6M8F2M8_9GAMM|nr:protease inhibitor I42 family protein [Pseudomonas campi]QKE62694.1 protease inhibitor I42 family protein [Pseudomonas campi]
MSTAYRLLLPATAILLAACTHQPQTSLSVQEKQLGKCPMELSTGQTLVISLPSNPTTGFRWVVADAAPGVLRSLGPEVYTTPEDAGLVGSAGQSTWRYQAQQSGNGRLLMHYQRPWEVDVAPAKTIDCQIAVD